MRLLLVHNPNSGDTDHERDQLVELLRGAGHQVDYRSSKGGWERGLATDPEIVVVAGGDGTVGEVARKVCGSAVPMAILPTGTANNIARFLGVADVPLAELVAGWSSASIIPFDLGVAHGPWGTAQFLESVGLGVLTQLMSEVETGGSGYVNALDDREERIEAAMDELTRIVERATPVRCDLVLDGVALTGEYLLVEVLNFGAAGPNLRLAPHADGSDGLLDVVLIEAHERAGLRAHLEALRAGREPGAAHAARHAHRVAVRCSGARLHLDDELWPDREGPSGDVLIECSLERHALTFLVPGGSQMDDAA